MDWLTQDQFCSSRWPNPFSELEPTMPWYQVLSSDMFCSKPRTGAGTTNRNTPRKTIMLASAVQCRRGVAAEPDETADAVRRKERIIDALQGATGPLAAWRAVRDAWCAVWFWPAGHSVYGRREWAAFSAALRGSESGIPERLVAPWRDPASQIASRERFFHWELEFPELFFDDGGLRLGRAGFYAVIGNPPWTAAAALTAFSRESGCYRLQSAGHANLYQLFAERMLQLAAPDGRVGMLMPAGILADKGCARLREELFSRAAIDAVI